MTSRCNLCGARIIPAGAIILNSPPDEFRGLYTAHALHFQTFHPDIVGTITALVDSYVSLLLSRLTTSEDPRFRQMQFEEASVTWAMIHGYVKQPEAGVVEPKSEPAA